MRRVAHPTLKVVLVVLVVLASCLARPAWAEAPKYDELEGSLSSRPASARLSWSGRALTGALTLEDGEELNVSGKFLAEPLSDGLTTCTLEVEGTRARTSKHRGASFRGICELGERDGTWRLSLEGYWRERGGREQPVLLSSRRELRAALWRTYGRDLPSPTTGSGTPPANCASTDSIDAVARTPLGLVLVLHSRHHRCVDAQGLDWSSYAAALSSLEHSAGVLRLSSSIPVEHAWAGASDVVDWSAGLATFWLTPEVLGVVVSAGGVISGNGVITQHQQQVFAISRGARPRLLLTLPGGSFGKSGLGNAGGDSVNIFASAPTRVEAAVVSVQTAAWAMVDGVEQPGAYSSSVYRFDSQRVALRPAPSSGGARLTIVRQVPSRLVADVQPAIRPTSKR